MTMHTKLIQVATGLALIFNIQAALAWSQVPDDRTVTKIRHYTTYSIIDFEPAFSDSEKLL